MARPLMVDVRIVREWVDKAERALPSPW